MLRYVSEFYSGFQGAILILQRDGLYEGEGGGGKPKNLDNVKTVLLELLTKELIHLEGKYFVK